MTAGTPKIKYLTNKDLLEEIHKSKLTYCAYDDAAHSRYDVIVKDLKKITKKRIDELRRKKQADLQLAAKKEQIAKGIKNPKINIPLNSIKEDSIVFRVMTYQHIPLNPEKEGKAKTLSEQHLRCNFPPFQHYIRKNGELVCVLKSHWKGGLKNGEFSKDHGKMTNNLAMMFMKLVDRYGHRGNWRGYCVDTETEALTDRGWLGINEISETDKIMSYSNGKMTWSTIKSIYRGRYNGLMHKLTVTGMDALITPNHKIVTERGLIPAELLLESDKIILMGKESLDGTGEYSTDLVKLFGWIVTNGCFEINEKGIKTINIHQSVGSKADRIRQCLASLKYRFSESKNSKNNICFSISRENSRQIYKLMPEKNLTMKIINNLTAFQRHILINTMIDGDVYRTGKHMRYVQKSKAAIDMFQALCALSGLKTNCHFVEHHMSFGKPISYYQVNIFSPRHNVTNGKCINFHGGKRNGRSHVGRGKHTHPNEPTQPYNGMVWCPETEYGCFLARRNGKVYLTGNTYIDEMKCQALLQLSQVGLQFDESRSDTPNPFAYYTQTITNSFMRILNIEKKNQNIRDDILIMNGANPSYTRQTEESIKQQNGNSS
jgi:hypothetical protein